MVFFAYILPNSKIVSSWYNYYHGSGLTVWFRRVEQCLQLGVLSIQWSTMARYMFLDRFEWWVLITLLQNLSALNGLNYMFNITYGGKQCLYLHKVWPWCGDVWGNLYISCLVPQWLLYISWIKLDVPFMFWIWIKLDVLHVCLPYINTIIKCNYIIYCLAPCQQNYNTIYL